VTVEPGELFASAESCYARYRPAYPAGVFDYLAARLGLTGQDTVLDVGCGPGQASVPLAARVGTVVAIDPLPGMLDLGRAAAREAGVTNIDWRRADSTRLADLGVTGARAAVFAAVFHWVDRRAVAQTLDDVLAPDGAIVVISDPMPPDPRWVLDIAEIRARHLGSPRRTNSGVFVPPTGGGHVDVLRASPFRRVDTVTWSWRRRLTVDEVVGLQFSYSFSTPALLGGRAGDFARDVRAAVLARHPDGVVTEPLARDVTIARRP
jgi:SAM-dependent methyltransferase